MPLHYAAVLMTNSGTRSLPLVGEMPSPLLWALTIVAFGVLLIVCVLILLRRQPGDVAVWDNTGAAGTETGRYLQHLHRLLRAIRAINSVVVTERDSLRLAQRACETLTTTRGYKMAWIGLVEEGSKRVRPVTSAGMDEGYVADIEVTWDDAPTGQGPTGRAIKSGEPSVMRDIETAPEFRPWRKDALQRGFRSSAALPLRCRGRVMGALNVYSEIPDAFDIEEVGLLQEVADHLAYALAAIALEEELAEARRDTRMGSHARAAFEHAPMGMMTSDQDGVVTSINSAMLTLLRRSETPGEVVDRLNLADLGIFHGSMAGAASGKALSEGMPVTFECRLPVSGGGTQALRCHGVPVFEEAKGLTGSVWLVQESAAEFVSHDSADHT